MTDPHELTVSLRVLGGQWETLGRDRYRGVWPEHFQATADAWGPATCSFELRRESDAIHPDLSAFTPCRVEIAGLQCWSGRVKETPTREGPDGVISVQGEGWQYHLDDDVYDRAYVHTRMTEWIDVRAPLTANLTRVGTAAGSVQSGERALVISWPKGAQLGAASPYVGVMLDLGASAAYVKRIVLSYEKPSATATAGLFSFRVRNNASEDVAASGASFEDASTTDITALGATGTIAVTFTTPRRYVGLVLFYVGTGGTLAEDDMLRFTSVKCFTSTAYESGNVSILKADQVIADALARATSMLNPDRSGIQGGTFSIPEHVSAGPRTPREAWTAVNAYENYDSKIDADARPIFRPRPTAPMYEIGEWSGADFQDASANSGDGIYNRVLVQGTGPDGAPITVTRDSAGDTLIDRQGFRRSSLAPVSTSLSTATGQRVGDLYLQMHRTTPFRGDFQAVGQGGVRRVLGGETLHPGWLLRDSGELVRCTHLIDPDTGGAGRVGRIAAVAYDHDQLTANISLDEDRAGFEALLARLAVVTG